MLRRIIYLASSDNKASANRENCIIGELLVRTPLSKNSLGGKVQGFEMDEDCSTRGN
jgi:hypothetical protein